jgi:hypothetical protein
MIDTYTPKGVIIMSASDGHTSCTVFVGTLVA